MGHPTENFLLGLSDKLMPRSWDGGYVSLSVPEQVFVCIWELEAEVNNGGFQQYYGNSAGDHAEEAAAALRTLEAKTMADIVEQANAVFPSGPPADHEERQEFVDDLDDAELAVLESLDDAFLEYPDDLSTRLATYVELNRAEFTDL